MNATYEDTYFGEDALFMERNSRDFRRRIGLIDANTEAICDFLHARSVRAPDPPVNAVIKDVFYPKWQTRDNYDRHRVRVRVGGQRENGDGDGGEKFAGGFGGLFSITFTSLRASRAFFDALPCVKGPSLGTNFTLACPYTILAHFAELEWARGFGVEEALVRVSVGMEEREGVLSGFERALEVAERVVVEEQGEGEGEGREVRG